MMSLPVWLPCPMVLPGVSVPVPCSFWEASVQGVSVWELGSLSRRQGFFVRGGGLPHRIRKADGPHPSGMLSCLKILNCHPLAFQ